MEPWEERALEPGVYPIDTPTLLEQLGTTPPDSDSDDPGAAIREGNRALDLIRYRVAREDRLAALARRAVAAGPVADLAPVIDEMRAFLDRHYPDGGV